jgi:hypothetical protein
MRRIKSEPDIVQLGHRRLVAISESFHFSVGVRGIQVACRGLRCSAARESRHLLTELHELVQTEILQRVRVSLEVVKSWRPRPNGAVTLTVEDESVLPRLVQEGLVSELMSTLAIAELQLSHERPHGQHTEGYVKTMSRENRRAAP